MLNRRRVVFIVSLLALAVMALLLFRENPPNDPTRPTSFVPAVWNAARLAPMHEVHVGKEKIECVKCHADGFGKSPGATGCASCHEPESTRSHRGAPDEGAGTSCLSCHGFAAGVPTRPCAGCHTAADAGPREGDAARDLRAHTSTEATCGACHVAHAEHTRVDVRAECTGCHEGRVAHGSSVVASDPARERDAAAFADGGPDASAAIQVCTSCHAPHTPKAAARATCAKCHTGKSAQPHEACITCHDPHTATKVATRSCQSASCHGGKQPSAGHAACTTCHTPHTPTSAAATCKGCHAGVSALASATVPEHATCTSCHEPHARGGAEGTRAPSLACVRCHADVHPSHPRQLSPSDSAGVGCTSCHAAHPAKSTPPKIAATCSSCHTKARDDQALHVPGPGGPACTGCHTPHAFALSGAAAGPALCGRCHAEEAKRVSARTGHAACAQCHGAAHAPVGKPSCASCHAAEAATAPAGHARCVACHDAHSGSLSKVLGAGAATASAGAGATCATCHAAKATALHGALPGGCATCHRPHGPKGVASPPACASCHTPARLPGLHSVGAHAARCASCHVAHAPPKAERAACTTSCHLDRRSHQPEAQVCSGCHMFRR